MASGSPRATSMAAAAASWRPGRTCEYVSRVMFTLAWGRAAPRPPSGGRRRRASGSRGHGVGRGCGAPAARRPRRCLARSGGNPASGRARYPAPLAVRLEKILGRPPEWERCLRSERPTSDPRAAASRPPPHARSNRARRGFEWAPRDHACAIPKAEPPDRVVWVGPRGSSPHRDTRDARDDDGMRRRSDHSRRSPGFGAG